VSSKANMTRVLDYPNTHVLRNQSEYDAAVAEVDQLLRREPETGSPEMDRLEFLAVLIEAYETDRTPMPDADVSPQDVVDFVLEQQGLTRADLHDVLGGRSRVSEFFAGKRPLSLQQIRALQATLNIPADLLIHGT
jgi:HTH-type transcriptional regulator / antitoxin HigA